MNLRLLGVSWWSIVCPPSGAFHKVYNGCTPGELCSLLLALNYPHWYTSLIVVHLVTQGPRGSPDTITRSVLLT